jgi:pSer/pThr/pTyr-binding forkhead associated (FHA) protein
MLAIAVNALYTTLRRRGTTRQLAGAIVSAVICALLLLPALLWYNLRFNASLSRLEIGLVLVYVVLCGWAAPLGVTVFYCLFTTPRDSNTAGRLPGQRRNTTPARAMASAAQPPRRLPGVPAPFVYSADKAWGWLVYRSGKFTGQELALKRSIISIGREEDNEVWLDDDTISRYHAELAWDQGQVYVTDNDSLNGVLLNGRRIRTSLLVKVGDELEIGGHHFVLKLAQQQSQEDLSDPLLPQIRRIEQHRSTPGASSPGLTPGDRQPLKPTAALSNNAEREAAQPFTSSSGLLETWGAQKFTPAPAGQSPAGDISEMETMQMSKSTPLPERSPGLCIIRGGTMAGRSFLLDRNLLSLGQGSENDIVIPDASILRTQIQFARRPEGDYVRDQASRNGSFINGQPLQASHLLHKGDMITLGNIQMEYTLLPEAQNTPVLPISTMPAEAPLSLPFSLRLPSKIKEE